MSKVEMKRLRGRPGSFENKTHIGKALVEVKAGNPVSRYLSLKLVELEYLVPVEIQPETPTRGRRKIDYQLTTKGNRLASWAKNIAH